MEEGVREVGEGVGDTCGGCFNYVNMVTAVGGCGRANIESSGGVVVPSESFERGLVHITKLSRREDGVCGEVKGEVVESVVSTYGGVRVPGL